MNLKCLLGHEWRGCMCARCGKTRDEGHSWDACKCVKCGIVQDKDHDWSSNCEQCQKCGKTRSGYHSWEGCKCKRCRAKRNEGHQWADCRCVVCGDLRPCENCGGRTELFTVAEGEIPELTLSEAQRQVYYCENCKKLFCGTCVGVPASSSRIMMFRSKCPICQSGVRRATIENMAEMARLNPLQSSHNALDVVIDQIARTPAPCKRCGKHLSGLQSGLLSGSEFMSMLEDTPYPCKSCGIVLCMTCMSEIKQAPCPYCRSSLGW